MTTLPTTPQSQVPGTRLRTSDLTFGTILPTLLPSRTLAASVGNNNEGIRMLAGFGSADIITPNVEAGQVRAVRARPD